MEMWQSFDEAAARRKARARSIAGVVLFVVSFAVFPEIGRMSTYSEPQSAPLDVCHPAVVAGSAGWNLPCVGCDLGSLRRCIT